MVAASHSKQGRSDAVREAKQMLLPTYFALKCCLYSLIKLLMKPLISG